MHRDIKKIVYALDFEQALLRYRDDKNFLRRIESQVGKILREPAIGKPLRYTLKNRRRVHVGSFVLVYEFSNGELRFLDFDHHDKVYKKWL
jgi:mRNA-degrading endonuclease RelE of RelBE toxin-antitoxin system